MKFKYTIMKRLSIILCLCAVLAGVDSVAQEVDYNAVIVPGSATNLSNEEKLVQLAWRNNPANHIVAKQAKVSQLMLKGSHFAWLDVLGFRSNVNEFVLDPSQDVYGRASFYPLYNFSLVVPFSIFATNPLDTRRKRVELTIAEDRINAQKLSTRANILTLYTRYELAKERLKVQTDAEQDTNASLRLVEDNFKKGIETVQTYNNILERYTNHRLSRIAADAEVKILKIQIEEVIGVKLESVIPN